MHYLLDTNIFIAAMKGVDKVRDKLAILPLSDLRLSPCRARRTATRRRKESAS